MSKYRLSLMKEFDPLYQCPLPSKSLANTTNEDILEASFINDVNNFVEDIIMEAMNTVFPDKPVTVNNTFYKTNGTQTKHCEHDIEIHNLKDRIQELDQQILLKNKENEKIILLKDEELRNITANLKELENQLLLNDEALKNMKENLSKDKSQILTKDVKLITVDQDVNNSVINCTVREKEFEDQMVSFEKMLSSQAESLERLKMENDIATRHLSNLEIAFSDVHQKYERSKVIINGYRTNEDTLQNTLTLFKKTLHKYDANLEVMKEMGRTEIHRLAKELIDRKEEFTMELNKLMTVIKHLEIKNASLATSLEQKNIECGQLTKLCEEITTKNTGYF